MRKKKQNNFEDLDELEEFWKKKLKKIEEVEQFFKESDYYNFQLYLQDCFSVFNVDKFNKKYCLRNTVKAYYPLAGVVDWNIEMGIKNQGLNLNDVPIIPIIEYKLVPTGNIIIKSQDQISNLIPSDKDPADFDKFKGNWQKSKALSEQWGVKLNSIKEYISRYNILIDNEYDRYIPKDTNKIYLLPTEYLTGDVKNAMCFSTIRDAFKKLGYFISVGRKEKYLFVLEYYVFSTGDFEIFDPKLSREQRHEMRRKRSPLGRAKQTREQKKHKEKIKREKKQ